MQTMIQGDVAHPHTREDVLYVAISNWAVQNCQTLAAYLQAMVFDHRKPTQRDARAVLKAAPRPRLAPVPGVDADEGDDDDDGDDQLQYDDDDAADEAEAQAEAGASQIIQNEIARDAEG
jgi:hypothetical protein